jgi:hypothetical protein
VQALIGRGRAGRLSAAETLREAISAPLPPDERANYDQAVQAVCGALPEATFAAAWAEGAKLTLEAIALALALSKETTAPAIGATTAIDSAGRQVPFHAHGRAGRLDGDPVEANRHRPDTSRRIQLARYPLPRRPAPPCRPMLFQFSVAPHLGTMPPEPAVRLPAPDCPASMDRRG